jgi:hypothetical protein
LYRKKVPTNVVPAVAVIQQELALFRINGRKAFVVGIKLLGVKLQSVTLKQHLKHLY